MRPDHLRRSPRSDVERGGRVPPPVGLSPARPALVTAGSHLRLAADPCTYYAPCADGAPADPQCRLHDHVSVALTAGSRIQPLDYKSADGVLPAGDRCDRRL